MKRFELKGYKSARIGFGEALAEMGNKYPNLVVLGGDITESVQTSVFRDMYPERFFSIGIAEQNMATVAAGLSLTGHIPVFSTYGVFASGRAWDQIRTTICYSNLHVIIGGAHGGISVGPDGATHQALEEIAIMRCLPNITVFVPSDFYEAKLSVYAAMKLSNPVYIRFGREPVPCFNSEYYEFETGKGIILKEGSDAVIFACGIMAWEALQAAYTLEEENISCRVVNLHTIKPLDRQLIIDSAKKCGCGVTAEEHQLYGGLGSAVAEVLAQEFPIPLEMIGINDRFGESGKPSELLRAYGLTSDNIREAVKKAISRK